MSGHGKMQTCFAADLSAADNDDLRSQGILLSVNRRSRNDILAVNTRDGRNNRLRSQSADNNVEPLPFQQLSICLRVQADLDI